jgi:hypothetical protein
MEEINNVLALQDQPQLSEDDIQELEELADERQLEIKLEKEIEEYIIQDMLEEN